MSCCFLYPQRSRACRARLHILSTTYPQILGYLSTPVDNLWKTPRLIEQMFDLRLSYDHPRLGLWITFVKLFYGVSQNRYQIFTIVMYPIGYCDGHHKNTFRNTPQNGKNCRTRMLMWLHNDKERWSRNDYTKRN